MAQLDLLQLPQGKKARVVTINGGQGLVNKLSARGIRPGKEITKISKAFMGGPVTIKVDNSKIALGHGMAAGILVKVVGDK